MAVFKQLLAKLRQPEAEDDHVNTQYFVVLRSLYLKLEAKRQREFKRSPETSPWTESDFTKEDQAVARMTHLLAGPESWASSCEIELLLLYLFDEAAIEVELSHRLREVEEKLHPSAYEKYREEARNIDMEAKRALLGRLVSDLQWHHITTEKTLAFKLAATWTTGLLFLTSFIAFLCVMFMIDITLVRPDSMQAVNIVVTAGFWGATFSMLLGLRKRLENSSFDELKMMHKPVYLVALSMVGVGAATILYFFMQTGFFSTFVSLSLLPDLDSRLSEEQKGIFRGINQSDRAGGKPRHHAR